MSSATVDHPKPNRGVTVPLLVSWSLECRQVAFVAAAAIAQVGCPQVMSDDFVLGASRSGGSGGESRGSTSPTSGGTTGNGSVGATEAGGAINGSGGSSDTRVGGGAQNSGATTTIPGVGGQVNVGGGASSTGAVAMAGSGQAGNTSTSVGCPSCIYCTDASLSAPLAITFSDTTVLGTSPVLWSPALSADGLTLYFSATSTTNTTEQIFVATRGSRDLLDFSNVRSLFGSVADERGAPWLSSDGLTLYFFSDRSEGAGERDLWYITRPTTASSFGALQPILATNSAASEAMPMETQDRLGLYYTGTFLGTADIWRVTRKSVTDSYSTPTAITELNSSSVEGRLTLTSDNRVAYFSSNRANSGVANGVLDLWTATRDEATGKFVNLKGVTDADVNTTSNEMNAALSADNTELFFVSNRNGRAWIFRSLRQCK